MDLTTGGGGSGFEYGSDNESVVARIAVDIPTEGIQSLRELTNETQRFRVELEAASRASGDFLGYLKQLPQIQAQIVQTQRALTAQLERTLDAQQRLTAGGSSGVPTGTYQQPWAGVASGMSGRAPSMADASHQMGSVDTRSLYMMNNERPGGLRPGDMNPQVSTDEALLEDSERHTTRESATSAQTAKTSGAQRGIGDRAKMIQNLAGPMINEMGAGGSWEGVLRALSQGAGGLKALGGAGGTAALDAMGLSSLAGPLSSIASVAGPLAAAAGGLALFEKGGNMVEGWRQMGQMQGGGWHEGAKDQGKIMTMALNPFITMEQARKIVQGSLSEGYSGHEFETVTDFVASNLKSMNLDISSSFALMRKNVKEGGASQEDVQGTLGKMQELSKSGYLSSPERAKELVATSEGMVNAGYTGQQADQFALNAQQMFAGDKTLAGLGSSMNQSITGNQKALVMAVQLEGIQMPPGTLPGAYGKKLAEMGIDPTEVMSNFVKILAQRAQQASGGDDDNGTAMFQMFLQRWAPDLKSASGTVLAQDFTACQKLYLEYIGGGGGDPYKIGAQTAGEGRPTPDRPVATHHPAPRSPAAPTAQAAGAYNSGVEVVNSEGKVEEYTGDQGQRDQLSSGKAQWRHKGDQGSGTSLAQTPNHVVNNNYYGHGGGGQSGVQGTLNINVNPSEFQRALGVPQQVTLNPNEVQANQGWGTATRNAPPPGYGG